MLAELSPASAVRAGLLVALLGTTFGTGPLHAQSETSQEVILLEPTAGQPIVGKVEVSFFFVGVADSEVEEVEIRLDGRRVATLTSAPWKTTIDGGDNLGQRTLEIKARLHRGGTLETSMVSRPIAFSEVDVRLVNLAVTATDRGGNPVIGLKRDDFTVYDNGTPVKIDRWDEAPAGLAVSLLIDTSLTMKGAKIEAAKEAAAAFIKELEPQDEVAIFAFDEDIDILHELSSDHAAAIAALDQIDTSGGTALYDAVFGGAVSLREVKEEFRRVGIVLSDGMDESASGLEPGSFHTLEEAVKKAHQQDVVMYSIGMGVELENAPDFTRRMTRAEVLTRIAQSTGGRYLRAKRWSALKKNYKEILEELRHQYTIAYVPPQPEPGERWRRVEVRVSRPKVEVRTREGYYVR